MGAESGHQRDPVLAGENEEGLNASDNVFAFGKGLVVVCGISQTVGLR